MKPQLKAPGTERLKLKYDNLLSISGFKCNLCRYITGKDAFLLEAIFRVEAWQGGS